MPDRPRPTYVRVARVTAGFALLPVGVALLVLPGPGIPLVVGGLMLLEGEFAFAGRARAKLETLSRAGVEWLQQRPVRRADRAKSRSRPGSSQPDAPAEPSGHNPE